MFRRIREVQQERQTIYMDLHSAKYFPYAIWVNTDKIPIKFKVKSLFDKWKYWESENFSCLVTTTKNYLNQG